MTPTEIIANFTGIKALIVGDVMVDAYWDGKVDRISPEAPVPVVHIRQKEYRLGGAANVALNMKGLGATAILCSIIGTDPSGDQFLELLQGHQLSSEGILRVDARSTTIKTRITSHSHQMIRLDEEDTHAIAPDIEQQLIDKAATLIKNGSIDVVVFQDYNKGALTPQMIEAITRQCHSQNIPVAVDPKRLNFLSYQGVTLFKPNLREIREALQIEIDPSDPTSLHVASQTLREQLHTTINMITLSQYGVFIDDGQQPIVLPAHKRSISDVSGAGDTVISVAALCLALKVPSKTLASLSNLAGGLVCEQFGVVPVNAAALSKEAARLQDETHF